MVQIKKLFNIQTDIIQLCISVYWINLSLQSNQVSAKSKIQKTVHNFVFKLLNKSKTIIEKKIHDMSLLCPLTMPYLFYSI